MSATIVDGPTTVEVILDQGSRWLTANHTGNIEAPHLGTIALNSTKPQIVIIYDYKQSLKGAINTIFLLEITDIFNYSNYSQKKRYDSDVRIDVICKHADRPNVLAISQEAKRVIETVSTSIGNVTLPSGYNNCFSQIWVLRKRDESDKSGNLHMIVYEIVLKHIGVALAV